ncbi:hypothetical protein DFJ77DRAFT_23990 [Powellomyces hirtus]|nr:hypothetical protein DFJ77DRAFT_23990 [Powellomyces hirtus]
MDFQSQLRSALKSRPPGSATIMREKKAEEESPSPALSAGGTIRDRWKTMEKATSATAVTSPARKTSTGKSPVAVIKVVSETAIETTKVITEPPTERVATVASGSTEAVMPAAPMLPPAPGIPPGTIVVALADYEGGGETQLSMTAGETFKVTKWDYGNGWAYGSSLDGSKVGVFPQTYVQRSTGV